MRRPRQPKPSGHNPRAKWAARIGVLALIAGLALTAGHTTLTGQSVSKDGELVVNGGFENGKAGWRLNDGATSVFAIGTPGHSGRSAATILAQRTGTVALNDAKNTVGSTKLGTTYTVSAWMRSTTPAVSGGLPAQVRLREVNGSGLVSSGSKVAQLTGQWQRVSMTYTTVSNGSKLDLNVVGWGIPAGYGIQVDDVSMRALVSSAPGATPGPIATTPIAPSGPAVSATATVPATTVPATTDPAPSATQTPASASPITGGGTPGGASVTYAGRRIGNCLSTRGIPSCGAFFGAAIDGNADPASKESQFGGKLALRRTYYQASGVDKAVETATADVAAGRVPWISFKLPYSWTDMADGKGDAWAKDLAVKLSKIDGPVWVAFHHEPEGDGPITEWTRMQAHLSPIIRGTAPNAAFTIVVTGWQQVFGSDPSYKLDALWPGDGLADIIAFDAYNNYGVTKNGKMITKVTEMKEYYSVLAAFAARHHTQWAIGETGYTDQAAATDPGWLTRAQSDLISMGGVGLAYFDSSLNSQGSWPLDSAAKVAAFRSVLGGTIRIT